MFVNMWSYIHNGGGRTVTLKLGNTDSSWYEEIKNLIQISLNNAIDNHKTFNLKRVFIKRDSSTRDKSTPSELHISDRSIIQRKDQKTRASNILQSVFCNIV